MSKFAPLIVMALFSATVLELGLRLVMVGASSVPILTVAVTTRVFWYSSPTVVGGNVRPTLTPTVRVCMSPAEAWLALFLMTLGLELFEI